MRRINQFETSFCCLEVWALKHDNRKKLDEVYNLIREIDNESNFSNKPSQPGITRILYLMAEILADLAEDGWAHP